MIITPMIRNNICLNAHPQGCAHLVAKQIEYVRQHSPAPSPRAPKNVLIIGSSAGYGLASRIVCAFGYGAHTLGIAFEKAPSGKRTGTPGWYCTESFAKKAKEAGLKCDTIIGDAFSEEVRAETVEKIAREYGKIDLLVYSIASGLRTDPTTGITYRSALKPIGASYHARTIDPIRQELSDVDINPATDTEIEATIKVMGGEDWKLWSDMLIARNLFSEQALNIAYSYIGPALTFPIYRDGTIGLAKIDLEKSAKKIDAAMGSFNGHAYVSVNKAVVTRASAVIPVVPLYLAILFKVMKARNTHEDVIHQMRRLFATHLYGKQETIPVDAEGRIRIDDWEMDAEVQAEIAKIWPTVSPENLSAVSDLKEYYTLFLNIHGFGFPDIDYQQETSI